MDKINIDKYKEIIEAWFKHNKTRADTISNTNIINFGLNSQKFIILNKFYYVSLYYEVIGYFVDKNDTLNCRFFYKSKSESAWRVGLGWRSDGQYLKGLENQDLDEDMFGGYIGEGLLQDQFSKYIDDMNNFFTIDSNQAILGKNSNKDEINGMWDVVSKDTNLRKYFVSEENGDQNEIQKIYAKARKKTENNLIKLINNKNFKYNEIYEKFQPEFQANAFTKIPYLDNKHSSKNIANTLKEDSIVWDAIIKNMSQHPVRIYEFYHDSLNENCIVELYSIYNIIIEIARTKMNLSIAFKTNKGSKETINTPICWVKSCYLTDPSCLKTAITNNNWGNVSTFGNYTEYGNDLWFLVQKPIDYNDDDSMSDYIKNRNGEIINKKISFSYRYSILALYNEKYSKVIYDFKIKKGFNCFRFYSDKYKLSQFSLNPLTTYINNLYDTSISGNAVSICFLIRLAIIDYKAHNYKILHLNGFSRADKIDNLITKFCYNSYYKIEEISTLLYENFNSNKIIGHRSKINSLFYFILVKILNCSDFEDLFSNKKDLLEAVNILELIKNKTPKTKEKSLIHLLINIMLYKLNGFNDFSENDLKSIRDDYIKVSAKKIQYMKSTRL